MNLALEKEERVTMGSNGRSGTGGKAGEVTMVVANVLITDGWDK